MSHSSATSSRRSPRVRRRDPRRSPTSSGCSATRRARRKAPNDARSTVCSMSLPQESRALQTSVEPPCTRPSSQPRATSTTDCESVVEQVLHPRCRMPSTGRGERRSGLGNAWSPQRPTPRRLRREGPPMAKWTAADLPDMTGKTVLITGAGSGIGLITARELGRVGARVVLGVRSTERGRRAIAGMPGDFDVRHLDVADLTSVREFAQAWTGDLDVLINNAGVMDVPAARTADGFDVQTATNYT